MSEQSAPAVRVLVVTDQESVRGALRYGFPDDIEVTFAVDSREAVRSLPQIAPSVVVVDLQTGSAGGYGLARDMAADVRWARVPIIMLLDREQDIWLARQAGARITVTKPVAAGVITEAVRSLTESAPSTS
ncbi:MAG TPA: response regulator [Actinomycetota bacterium]|nr:response regulator [Actinomycetota bacterium]